MIDYKIKKYIYLYDKFDQLWTLFLKKSIILKNTKNKVGIYR